MVPPDLERVLEKARGVVQQLSAQRNTNALEEIVKLVDLFFVDKEVSNIVLYMYIDLLPVCRRGELQCGSAIPVFDYFFHNFIVLNNLLKLKV